MTAAIETPFALLEKSVEVVRREARLNETTAGSLDSRRSRFRRSIMAPQWNLQSRRPYLQRSVDGPSH